MKARIALFQHPEYDWMILAGITEPDARNQDNYGTASRITEYVEIDFPSLPRDVYIKTQLAILDVRADSIRDKCNNELAVIEDARRKLLALPPPDPQP
mgnify:FL=1